ncbi:MAG: hypothetical protein IIV14_00770 [Bacteroidaceae bacterium]|nr:hypothetical protein [Bacteroidaceae bacterium]
MTELKKTTKIVKAILEEDKQARNSDSFLYLRVLEHIATAKELNLYCIPVPLFLKNMKEYGFPPFESVRRARQKIQQTIPELKGCDAVVEQRLVNEEKYKAYARAWRCVE